jgi:hypothetical protein
VYVVLEETPKMERYLDSNSISAGNSKYVTPAEYSLIIIKHSDV